MTARTKEVAQMKVAISAISAHCAAHICWVGLTGIYLLEHRMQDWRSTDQLYDKQLQPT